MSMMEPGLGDLIDRLFILKRKQIDGQKEYREEEELVAKALELELDNSKAHILFYAMQLCVINATIWQRTDEAKLPGVTNHSKELAHSLLALNDNRHIIVNALNRGES